MPDGENPNIENNPNNGGMNIDASNDTQEINQNPDAPQMQEEPGRYNPNSRQQMQNNLNASTDRKMGELVARGADKYFTGGAVGAAVDTAEKIPVVGGAVSGAKDKLFDAVGKPIGKIVDGVDNSAGTDLRGAANTANQAGAFDVANQAIGSMGGAGGAAGAAAGGAPGGAGMPGMGDSLTPAPSTPGGSMPNASPNSDASSLPDLEIPKELDGMDTLPTEDEPEEAKKTMPKIPLTLLIPIIGGSMFLFFIIFIIAVSPNVGAVLDLTSGSTDGLLTNNTINYTTEEIENILTYVGDSRTVGMSAVLPNNKITYIAEEAAGYDWFTGTGQIRLEEKLADNNLKFIVFALGINDLGKVDSYLHIYNVLVSEYSNANFYFMAVNPVDEALTSITNAQIEAFNASLASAFGDKFIDTYNGIKQTFNAPDGVHYDAPTYQRIHNIVIEYIKSKNKIEVPDYEGSLIDPDYNPGETVPVEATSEYPLKSPTRGKYGWFSFNEGPAGREISQDPQWVEANMIYINFPCSVLNNSVRIHRLAKANFDAAFGRICELVTTGINGIKLSSSNVNYGGAYVSRRTSAGGFSNHAWGIAIDFNYNWSTMIGGTIYRPYKSMGSGTYNEYQRFLKALGNKESDSRNINYILWKYAFEPAGFKWGGNWSVSSFDPMHYEIDWNR